MITSKDFDKLVYRKPDIKDSRPMIDKIIGIDSEAYDNGVPFMFGTSLSHIYTLQDLPDCFFTPDYNRCNFVAYNMKYDSGALLYNLSNEAMHELWEFGTVKYNEIRYSYIPHKRLKIQIDKEHYVTVWDIAQFYNRMSLQKASEVYLKESKIDMQTKTFTKKYVKRFWKSIAKYCIQDAVLTAKLGEYLITKLYQFNLTAPSLFSCASLSARYFCDNARPLITVWKYWQNEKRFLKLAMDAYAGGKFEVTSRGKFNGVEFDITSAYPYEIANLININTAIVKYTTEYQDKAVYGFIRCIIDNEHGHHVPCGVKIKNVQIFPAGKYYLTITKNEYDYLISIGVKVTILDAGWLFVKRRNYPYMKVIDDLFRIKKQYKGKDLMLTMLSKICMNSFYGKNVQVIKHPRTKKYHAGNCFNPVYGAVITANTRLLVTDIQNRMGDDCLAVHTDSVICTRDIDPYFIRDGIGEFERVVDGTGYLIACGMYQIGKQCAFKGFRPQKGETWESILSRFPNHSKISRKYLHVESWVEAMAKNHSQSLINVFNPKMLKEIDLNCDSKRIWLKKVKGKDLLNGLENSLPKIHVENTRPNFW